MTTFTLMNLSAVAAVLVERPGFSSSVAPGATSSPYDLAVGSYHVEASSEGSVSITAAGGPISVAGVEPLGLADGETGTAKVGPSIHVKIRAVA